jgi:capsular exopolysaccharide synthesis family protein
VVKHNKRFPAKQAQTRQTVPFRPGGSPADDRGDAKSKKPLVEGVPLGTIVPRVFSDDPQLLMLNQPNSAMAERFRRLAVRLEQMIVTGNRPPKVVVVTSAVPGDGKTFTAVNLAMAMAEDRNSSVLLVDGDLRRPSIGRYLMNPKPQIGLNEVLSSDVPLDHAIVHMKNSRLQVLPSGAQTKNPLEFIRSRQLEIVIGELRKRYDKVVFDTPPSVSFADAASVLPHADGALVVVKAGKTSKPMVEKALEALSQGTVLGAILNDVQYTVIDRYYYQYDYEDPDRYAKGSKS